MAVHTHITKAQLEDFLKDYDLGALERFEGIAEGIENSNFHVFTDRTRAVLTVFEKRTNSDDLPFFMAFMAHLSGLGIPCPAPVRRRDGTALGRIAGKSAVLLEFIEGASARSVTPDHAHATGEMLARMHKASEHFRLIRANAMDLPVWEKLITTSIQQGKAVFGEKIAELPDELPFLKAHWPAALPQGAVHADFFPDNVFFDNKGRVSGVLDFYFACTDILAYDLMIAFNAWCFDKEGLPLPENASALLTGYESIRPLLHEEKKFLPLLGRAAALRIIATRLYDWFNTLEGSSVTKKSPLPYLNILEFHREKS